MSARVGEHLAVSGVHVLGEAQVERDCGSFRLVQDVGRLHLERDRAADGVRRSDGLLRRARSVPTGLVPMP